MTTTTASSESKRRRDVLMGSGKGERKKAAIFFVSGWEKNVPSWEKLGKTLSVNKGCFLV
jgi:hypothetical protein